MNISKTLLLGRYVLFFIAPMWLMAYLLFLLLAPEEYLRLDGGEPAWEGMHAVAILFFITVPLPMFCVVMGVTLPHFSTRPNRLVSRNIASLKDFINALRIERTFKMPAWAAISYYAFCIAIVVAIVIGTQYRAANL